MTSVDYDSIFEDLANQISEICKDKGFWDYSGVPSNAMIPIKLALIHTEISEALEVHRNKYDKDDGVMFSGMTPYQEELFTEELADIVIRVLDIVGHYQLNRFGSDLIQKVEMNRARPYLHNKRY